MRFFKNQETTEFISGFGIDSRIFENCSWVKKAPTFAQNTD